MVPDLIALELQRAPEVDEEAIEVSDDLEASRAGAAKEDRRAAREWLAVLTNVAEAGPDLSRNKALTAAPGEGCNELRSHGLRGKIGHKPSF
jgi:hypothetical protein